MVARCLSIGALFALSFSSIEAQGRVPVPIPPPFTPQFATETFDRSHWMPDGESYWFSRKGDAGTEILFVGPQAPEPEPVFDVERLRKAYAESVGKLRGEGVPFRGFEFTDGGRAVRFQARGSRLWRLQLEDYSITQLPRESAADRKRSKPRRLRGGFSVGEPDIMELASPNGTLLAGDDERNLYIRSATTDDTIPLTDDGVGDYEYTVNYAQWSDDSRYLVALRSDERATPRLPLVDWTQVNAEVETHPYTKAGQALATSELHVFDVQELRHVRIEETGIQDHVIFPLHVDTESGELWFMRMHRICRPLELFAADLETGKARLVLREDSETFIGGLDFYLSYANWFEPVGDGEHFLWLSERDGWRHVYLYDQKGQLVRQLTSGELPVQQVAAVDVERGWVYFLAYGEADPYETHLYRVSLEGEHQEQLTEGPGAHAVDFSPALTTYLDSWSSVTHSPEKELRHVDGTLAARVSDGSKGSSIERFTAKAADGETTLHGVLFKPRDFDPKRRYPVIDAIYGGPFIQWVPRTYGDGRSFLAQSYANMGFVVFTTDARGTIGRGKAFQDVIYLNWGRTEIADHAAVLKELGSTRPWMDLERVGIFGGSWGGYMTLRAILTHPDVYHAAVASAFVCDLYDHASVPIEGYMGLPEDHREGYDYASNLLLADQLEGELLLIHGTADVNATFSAAMKMTLALIEAGKQHDLIVVPGANHALAGSAQGYVEKATRSFFVEHLRADEELPVR